MFEFFDDLDMVYHHPSTQPHQTICQNQHATASHVLVVQLSNAHGEPAPRPISLHARKAMFRGYTKHIRRRDVLGRLHSVSTRSSRAAKASQLSMLTDHPLDENSIWHIILRALYKRRYVHAGS